jgi:uncharacterized protein (UPF0332 family)
MLIHKVYRTHIPVRSMVVSLLSSTMLPKKTPALKEPLDPKAKVELYLKLCEKYLSEAEDYMSKKDYIQASEKAWGAAVQIIKALAAREGRDLRSHKELHEYLAYTVRKVGDIELRRIWSAAGELHRNFYEAWLPPELVNGYFEDVKEFVNRLRKLLQR